MPYLPMLKNECFQKFLDDSDPKFNGEFLVQWYRR